MNIPSPNEYLTLDEETKKKIMDDLHNEIQRQKEKYLLKSNNENELYNSNNDLDEFYNNNNVDNKEKYFDILNRAKNNLNQIKNDIIQFSNKKTYEIINDENDNNNNINNNNINNNTNNNEKFYISENNNNNNNILINEEENYSNNNNNFIIESNSKNSHSKMTSNNYSNNINNFTNNNSNKNNFTNSNNNNNNFIIMDKNDLSNEMNYQQINNNNRENENYDEEQPKNLEDEINNNNNIQYDEYNVFNPLDYIPNTSNSNRYNNYNNNMNNENFPIHKNNNKFLTKYNNSLNNNYNSSLKKRPKSVTSNKLIPNNKNNNNNINSKKNSKNITKSFENNQIMNDISNHAPKYKNIQPRIYSSSKSSKTNEKFRTMKKELEQKFIKEHPFKPQIQPNIQIFREETEKEKIERLSKPKTIEINERIKIREKIENDEINNEKNFYPNNILNNNKINPKTVSDRLYNLHNQLKIKREKLKREFEDNDIKQYSFAPEINEKSKIIMNKYNNNNNKNLYERGEEFEKSKENFIRLKKIEQEKEMAKNNKPFISEKSKELALISRQYNNDFNENDDIFTRLYNQNIRNEKHPHQNKDLKECSFFPKCNNSLYFTENEDGFNNNGNIEDFLERQKIYEEIKKEKIEKKINKNNEKNNFDFKPKINLTSEILMKTNEQRIMENKNDKFNRLYNDAQKIKERKEQLENFYNAQFDFKPKINELSKFIAKDFNNNNINNNNNSTIHSEYINNLTKNNFHNQNYIDEECTFKPNIYKNNNYNYVKSNYKNDDGILDRITQEQKNKIEKIKDMQNIQNQHNFEECNFSPEINKKMPNFEENKPIYMKGMAKYLNQMEKARQAKREKEQREKEVFITGENWNKNNLITVPKPFKLSYQNNKKINDIKKLRENEEMKECTFKPKTNESKNKEIIKQLLKD